MNYYVFEYSAAGISDDAAIKKCLRAAMGEKGAVIIFDRKDWLIREAVCLPSDITVIIDDCMIKQADETYDNIFRADNYTLDPCNPDGLPVGCEKRENIKIIGRGKAVLSGPDKNRSGYHPVMKENQEMVGDFWGWRTLQIVFSRCDNVEISGLSIIKTRCWAVSFDFCKYVTVRDIRFDSDVKNGDGIDFRSGCQHCLAENITGNTSDDTIACTALRYYGGSQADYPRKNYLYPLEPSLCLPRTCSDDRDIYDITIRNISTSGRHHCIICLAANGCRVHDVNICGIDEQNGEWREATVKIYTGYGADYNPGDIYNINVKNVSARYADNAVYCNTRVGNVTLENIKHVTPGKAIKLDYPENITIK